MSFYEVKVVSRAAPHTVLATFNADQGDGDTRQKATVTEVSWQLNEPGVARIRIPLFHPAALAIQALRREVQVWRNGTLIFWGVPVQRDPSGGFVEWTCPGLLWYFTRRYFGPVTTNYLANPLFATNLSGWTKVGFDPTLFTATHSTAIRLRGPGTARLVVPSTVDRVDEVNNYLEQTFNVPTTTTFGLFLAVVAWYWIDPTVAFAAPALEQRGLYVSSPAAVSESPAWEPITMNAPPGKRERCEINGGIHLAPNLTNVPVTVRLYCPVGAIHWGAASVTAEESVSSEMAGTDVTEMLRLIVNYAQSGAGKSPLHMLTSTPAAGVKEIIAYQFKDLGNVFDAMRTYPQRGLADFDIAFHPTNPTSRTFTTYAPRKGAFRSGHGLVIPGSSVIRLASHSLDGQQTATRVIRRGAGEGSDREYGQAVDASPLDGLILEDIGDAPPEVGIDDLDRYATTDLARLKQVVSLPEVQVPAEGWLGVVRTGDTVPATINWGDVQETANQRVTSLRLDPQTDTLLVGTQVP